MKKIILVISILLSITNCNKDDNNDKYPSCLEPLINNFIDNFDPQTPRANIEKYLYEGNEVYVLNFQNFPDGQSSVVSLECGSLCALGGLDGAENDCLNWESAKYIETVWTDKR